MVRLRLQRDSDPVLTTPLVPALDLYPSLTLLPGGAGGGAAPTAKSGRAVLSGGGRIVPVGRITSGPPVTTGWPDQNNTGLALHQGVPYANVNYSGLTVFTGLLTITQAGSTWTNCDFRRRVEVRAANVTFIGCRFRAPDNFMMQVIGTSGTRVQKCEFDGMAGAEDNFNISSTSSTSLAVMEDCNIWGFGVFNGGDGGKVGSNTEIHRCFIHDSHWVGGQPHIDGLQVMAGSNILVTGCNIVANDYGLPSPQGDWTSCLMMSADTGNGSNMRVIGNRLVGIGTHNIACYFWRDVNTGMQLSQPLRFDNNRVGSTSTFQNGILAISSGVTMTSVSGNVWDATGLPASL